MDYGKETRDAILSRLAAGESLRKACEGEDMPEPQTVLRWVQAEPNFAEQYARAREVGYLLLADEILEISDDSTGDMMLTEHGEKPDTERVARSKLRVDSRKWLLSKMLPKVYGDKLAIGGADDMPPIKTQSDDQLNARIAALQEKLNAANKG